MRSNLSILRDLLDIAMHRRQLSVHLTLQSPTRPRYQGGSWHWYVEQAAQEVWRLKVLADHEDGIHERINARWALKQHIDRCTVDGMIGIVESGRDCDCVEYVHPCQSIPATVYHYKKLERDKAQWADGPFSLSIVTPKQADETESESRDLALEAYENGHPHHIVSRFA